MIEFTANVNGEGIAYSDCAFARDMDIKSVLSWVYFDAVVANQTYGSTLYSILGGNTSSWSFVYNYPSAGYIGYYEYFINPNGFGVWRTNQILTSGSWLFTAVTYNRTSPANDPVLYLNGASVAITETSTPSGTAATGTGNSFSLGNPSPSVYCSIDGKMASYLLYNRILSAQEILDAYNSRLAVPTYRGLVFAPNLMGAAGGVTDGSTLAAENKITDVVSGVQGTPAGSPILRADTVLVME